MTQDLRHDWETFENWLGGQALREVEPGLASIERALWLADYPTGEFGVISVAGTNGKGSTCAYLSSILSSHGLEVGLFTSPHLISLDERFRVDGEPVDKSLIAETARDWISRFDDKELDLSYFEWTTFFAAVLFRRIGIDVGIFEVGLGGRLDATNAFGSDLSVLTPIGFDHTDFLGDTIRQIAQEKCGILGSEEPVVVGKQNLETARVVISEYLGDRQSLWHADDYEIQNDGVHLKKSAQTVGIENFSHKPSFIRDNITTAVAAAELYLAGGIRQPETSRGIQRCRWPGRGEVMDLETQTKTCRFFVDAAHNTDSLRSLLNTAQTGFLTDIDRVIFTAMADKEFIQELTTILADTQTRIDGLLLTENDRAFSKSDLDAAIPDSNLGQIGRVEELLPAESRILQRKHGRFRAGPEKPNILALGSTYLVAAIYEHFDIDAGVLY